MVWFFHSILKNDASILFLSSVNLLSASGTKHDCYIFWRFCAQKHGYGYKNKRLFPAIHALVFCKMKKTLNSKLCTKIIDTFIINLNCLHISLYTISTYKKHTLKKVHISDVTLLFQVHAILSTELNFLIAAIII